MKVYRQNLQNVKIHLLQYEIMQTYTVWHQHGEPHVSNEAYHDDEMQLEGYEIVGCFEVLVEDRITMQCLQFLIKLFILLCRIE